MYNTPRLLFCLFYFLIYFELCVLQNQKKNLIQDTEQRIFCVFTVMYWVWVWIGSMFGFMYIIEENDYWNESLWYTRSRRHQKLI